jgi:hypothetical protein
MALSLTHFNDEDTQPLYVEFLLTPVPRLVTWRLLQWSARGELS